MNINSVYNIENRNKTEISKRSRKAIAVCLFACTLMFLLQRYAGLLFPAANDEISYIIQSILLYLIYICVPFGIAMLIFKFSFKDVNNTAVKRIIPKKPFLYIAGTIGLGYVINLTINMLFSEFVEEFGMEMTFVPESPLAIILYYVQIALIPAILEEWAFRGVILKNLLPYGKGGAIIISSLLFGIAHLDLPRIIFATIFAMMLSVCYAYTNSLFVPIVIHFINNFISATVMIHTDNAVVVVCISFLMIALMGFGIGAVIYYSRKGIENKKVSLIKPANIGYRLTVGKYISNFFTNIGIVPYALIFAYFLYLIYYA